MGACGKGPGCGTCLKGRADWLRLILRNLLIVSLAASVPPFYTQPFTQHHQQQTGSLKATASSQLRTQLRELILLSLFIFSPKWPTYNYGPTGYTACVVRKRSPKSWVMNARPCRSVTCNKCWGAAEWSKSRTSMDQPLNIYSILLGIEAGTESTVRRRQESNKCETRAGCTRGRSQGAEGEGNETIFIFLESHYLKFATSHGCQPAAS